VGLVHGQCHPHLRAYLAPKRTLDDTPSRCGRYDIDPLSDPTGILLAACSEASTMRESDQQVPHKHQSVGDYMTDPPSDPNCRGPPRASGPTLPPGCPCVSFGAYGQLVFRRPWLVAEDCARPGQAWMGTRKGLGADRSSWPQTRRVSRANDPRSLRRLRDGRVRAWARKTSGRASASAGRSPPGFPAARFADRGPLWRCS